MFHEFTRWLDEYLRDHEPSVVLRAAIGLVTFASLLGAFFGSQTVRMGAFVAAIFCLMSGALLLIADRHGIKQERDTYLQRLNWYYDVLGKLSPEPLIAVDKWEQTVEIMPNGDAHEVLILDAVAPREVVFFARLTARSLWDQPKRQRRKITMTAQRVKADGSCGPHWNIMFSWQGDKLVSHLDLDPPIRRGETIRFRVERTWPAKCAPMMRTKKAEDFVLRTSNALEIRRAEYSVVLPKGFEAVYELIGEGEPDVQLSADHEEHNGRKTYSWCADKVPAKIGVGIRLQLK